IRTGRPHGVVIERNGSDMARGGYATRLSFAAQPRPYTGEVIGAKAILQADPTIVLGQVRALFGFSRAECGRLWAAAQTLQSGTQKEKDALYLRPGATLKMPGVLSPFRIDSITTGTVK